MTPGRSPLSFTKMSGGGNDFIVLDAGVAEGIADLPGFVAAVCRRGLAVGADDVLVVGADPAGGARLVHYNADGGRSGLCGNGSRCAARWARQRGLGGEPLRLRTDVGTVVASFAGPDRVRLDLGFGCGRPACRRLTAAGETVEGHFLEVGIPHFIVRVDRVEQAPVERLGRALRRHDAFRPRGTNVSFVAVRADGSLDVRTFERGVEGETLSCGTGCTAAAIVAVDGGWSVPPVICHTRSGVDLEVGLRAGEDGYENLSLAGDARVIYQAELSPEAVGRRAPVAPA